MGSKAVCLCLLIKTPFVHFNSIQNSITVAVVALALAIEMANSIAAVSLSVRVISLVRLS